MKTRNYVAAAMLSVCFVNVLTAADWQPAKGPLMTRWAKNVTPKAAHPDYPRPQMVRPEWTNLNGLWDYAVRPKDSEQPKSFDGKILVPFPIESALSGVMKTVGGENRLWYRRTIETRSVAECLSRGSRLLLHFGAVDWHAVISVNGKKVGEHKGGYDPFSFDITDALNTQIDEQEIVVSVWDPTDASFQPRGKQVAEPRGIWYTSVTGIWQTAWLEPVPAVHITSLKIVPDVDNSQVKVTVKVEGAQAQHRLLLTAKRASSVMFAEGLPGKPITVDIPRPDLWSPDSPALYDLDVTLSDARQAASPQQPLDRVTSYFGMRKIEFKKADDGFNRLFLNNKPLFQIGPLDQGWWPDGLYLAPTDEALRFDIEMTKKLGFNMCRKHVKVEPARWYYWCDKLGLMVWQDMPSGDKYIRPNKPDLERTPESASNYRREYQAMIDTHHNHPCIVTWVPFNEGWGQFDTDAILAWTKQYDPTRLVDAPSGWADRGTGDMYDMHRYPGPAMPEPEGHRAIVLGEFGGLGLPLQGHLWWDKRNWGYRTYKSLDELQQSYALLIRKLHPLVGAGLAAAVYTQTTDVEGEVNGLMTYDRAVVKYDIERMAALHKKLHEPPPIYVVKTLVPTSEKSAQTWRFTVEQPSEGWEKPNFDDSSWREGPGGFGRKDTPGAILRTPWHTNDIWMRRMFEIPKTKRHTLSLRIHHDEDAEVFLNGQRVASLVGYAREYENVELAESAWSALKDGVNTLAVHCRQTAGGQYIDVGLVDIEEKAPRASTAPQPPLPSKLIRRGASSGAIRTPTIGR